MSRQIELTVRIQRIVVRQASTPCRQCFEVVAHGEVGSFGSSHRSVDNSAKDKVVFAIERRTKDGSVIKATRVERTRNRLIVQNVDEIFCIHIGEKLASGCAIEELSLHGY